MTTHSYTDMRTNECGHYGVRHAIPDNCEAKKYFQFRNNFHIQSENEKKCNMLTSAAPKIYHRSLVNFL